MDAVVNTRTRVDNTPPAEQDHLTNGKRLSAVDRGEALKGAGRWWLSGQQALTGIDDIAGRQLQINKENMIISQRLQKIYKARSAPKSSEPIK